MAAQSAGRYQARPKSKTPAERSVEFDAVQAKLKAEAADRRKAAESGARPKTNG